MLRIMVMSLKSFEYGPILYCEADVFNTVSKSIKYSDLINYSLSPEVLILEETFLARDDKYIIKVYNFIKTKH